MVRKSFKNLLSDWKDEFNSHKKLIFFSLFFLILATIIDYHAGKYVTRVGDSIATDVIIDNIPAMDLSFIFVYVWLGVVTLLFLFPLLFRVSKLHEVISQFSLLIVVRSFFITLTHLKTPLSAIDISFPWFFNVLQFHNDLFFSGHTAVPFLGYLLFRKDKIRYFFLIASIVLGLTALIMHRHYTIDVLSAYFITYGTFLIGQKLFSVFEKKH